MAIVVNVSDSAVAMLSGSRFNGSIAVAQTGSFGLGISGSLTRLINGSSFIEAGENIVISSESNGQVTVSGVGFDPADASYLTLGLHATLTDERILTAESGVALTDGGAGGNLTVALQSVFIDTFYKTVIRMFSTDGYGHEFTNSTDGTYQTSSIFNTSFCSRSFGETMLTNTAANRHAGQYGNVSSIADHAIFRQDGFWMSCMFGVESLLDSPTSKCFFGLTSGTTGITLTCVSGSLQPSQLVTAVGVGFDSGDTTFSIIHSDTGSATKLPTGISASNGEVYFLRLKCPASGNISWKFMQLSSSFSSSGVLSTNIPATRSLSKIEFGISNGSSGNVVGARILHFASNQFSQLLGQSMFDVDP